MRQTVDLPPSLYADPEIGLLLSLLTQTTQEWREQLGNVPREVVNWQTGADGQSIGGLLLHIADVEGFWLHEAISGQVRPPEVVAALLSEETDQANARWPMPPDQPLDWYYARLEEVRAQTLAWVQVLHNADQMLVHPAREGKTYTARWLLGHVVTHEAYHGGQAVLLSLLHARTAASPSSPSFHS